MLQVNFPQQANSADWMESIQLFTEDDGSYAWDSVPSDLVVTLNVVNETRRGMGDVQIPYISQQTLGPSPVLSAVSTDGSGKLTTYPNGIIEINIPASTMSNLVGGFYEVYIKMQTQGATVQLLRGILPLVWGV